MYLETTFSIVINDEDVEFTCDGYMRPAQHGGVTDPSLDSYIELENIYLSGIPLKKSETSRELVKAAEDALISEFERRSE